jgi:hypothetical protein
MEKQLDTDISHLSGKVFNKTGISARFFGAFDRFSHVRAPAADLPPMSREQSC